MFHCYLWLWQRATFTGTLRMMPHLLKLLVVDEIYCFVQHTSFRGSQADPTEYLVIGVKFCQAT